MPALRLATRTTTFETKQANSHLLRQKLKAGPKPYYDLLEGFGFGWLWVQMQSLGASLASTEA